MGKIEHRTWKQSKNIWLRTKRVYFREIFVREDFHLQINAVGYY